MTTQARDAIKWLLASDYPNDPPAKRQHIIETWGESTWHEVLGVMIGGIIQDIHDAIEQRR